LTLYTFLFIVTHCYFKSGASVFVYWEFALTYSYSFVVFNVLFVQAQIRICDSLTLDKLAYLHNVCGVKREAHNRIVVCIIWACVCYALVCVQKSIISSISCANYHLCDINTMLGPPCVFHSCSNKLQEIFVVKDMAVSPI